MTPNESDLQYIAARSSTLWQRIAFGNSISSQSEKNTTANARLLRWSELVAEGDWDDFDRRLGWDGLDRETVLPFLGVEYTPRDSNLPDWAALLRECLRTIPEAFDTRQRFLDLQDPLPFEELLSPFVLFARRQVAARTGVASNLLTADAHKDLERTLLRTLVTLSSQVLELEFSVFRASLLSSLDRLLLGRSEPPPKTLYHTFVARMLAGELLTLLKQYPVLARLLATALTHWIDATVEFLERLAQDREAITTHFGNGAEPGPVVTVFADISDPHLFGRAVSIITFQSGLRIAYKPKNLGLELVFRDLLEWLATRGFEPRLRSARVINSKTHGWVEYIENSPCPDVAAMRRYYHRAGSLLAILYVLGSTDMHGENVIACGENPVLIDLETLFSHDTPVETLDLDGDLPGVHLVAQRQLDQSVARSGLLPRWQIGRDGHAYDVSALGNVGEQHTSFRVPKWEHVNTDRMVLRSAYGVYSTGGNVPLCGGERVPPDNFIEELVKGFQYAYCFIDQFRADLTAPTGPLYYLEHHNVRVILRPTRIYSVLLKNTLQPSQLRDGIDRSIELDGLARAMLLREVRPSYWPLLEDELAAMERLDIPFFTANSSNRDLICENRVIPEFFSETAIGQMSRRIHALTEEDMRRQTSIIRGAFYARTVDATHRSPVAICEDVAIGTLQPLSFDDKVACAASIAKELRDIAFISASGSSTWIGLEYVFRAQRFQLKPMGLSLYSGCTGIALFLAALEHVTGGIGYRDLALAAAEAVRHELRQPRSANALARILGLGGAKGIGSLIYGFVRLRSFLQDDSFLEDAWSAFELITGDAISADEDFDIMEGAAGMILGLIVLYQACAERRVLEVAVDCGHHLVKNRITAATGHRVWATRVGTRPLTGFSHGIAGIAYALLRLGEYSGERQFIEAAREAIEYEQALFSTTGQNWPDFRDPGSEEEPVFMTSWCNGAPGIGLARLGGLAAYNSPAIQRDMHAAMRATMAFGVDDIDNLCCGNTGRIDILLELCQHFKDPALRLNAEQKAAWIVSRAGPNRHFHLARNLPPGTACPGLFQGSPGIGYALLRLAYPDTIPSVLLWK